MNKFLPVDSRSARQWRSSSAKISFILLSMTHHATVLCNETSTSKHSPKVYTSLFGTVNTFFCHSCYYNLASANTRAMYLDLFLLSIIGLMYTTNWIYFIEESTNPSNVIEDSESSIMIRRTIWQFWLFLPKKRQNHYEINLSEWGGGSFTYD